MSDKVTFDCGAFLPGRAPGSIPKFDGGGTIDAGDGGDPPPPPPGGGGVTPIDPRDPIPPWELDPPGDYPNYPGDIIITYNDQNWPNNPTVITLDDWLWNPDQGFGWVIDDVILTEPGGTAVGGWGPTWGDDGVITIPNFPGLPGGFNPPFDDWLLQIFIRWDHAAGSNLDVDSVINISSPQLSFVDGDPPEPPDPPTWDADQVEVLYNDPTNGTTTIAANDWESGWYYGYIQTFTSTGGVPTTAGGVPWGWTEWGPGYTGISVDDSTGVITISNIDTTWAIGGVPSQILLQAFNSDTGEQTEVKTISVSTSEYDDGGPPGGGFDATALGGDFTPADGVLLDGETGGGTIQGDQGTVSPGADDTFGFPAPISQPPSPGLSQKLTRNTRDSIISDARRKGSINLNDPELVRNILKKKPFGVQESTIAFITRPDPSKLVFNDTGFTNIFKNPISSDLHYVLKNNKNTTNWDSKRAAAITPDLIFDSLTSEIKDILSEVRNYDGTKLTRVQIFNLIGSRVLDGTLRNFSISALKKLAENSKKREPVEIIKSSDDRVNEVAALALIDNNKFPLNRDLMDRRDEELFKNWKVLPSDVDMYIPIVINGVERRYYINDDETLIDRVTLSIEDGEYYEFRVDGKTQRLYTKSEKDHAFVLPERTRQKALRLLGGSTARELEVSANAATASAIEFDGSLVDQRQPYYLLSCNLTSLSTEPSLQGSFLVKDTTVKYELMDPDGDKVNVDRYLAYKANKRIFLIDDSDLLLDYVETTSELSLKQSDILFDSPKTNKNVPLLTRQIPWTIMLVPTNRKDYNLFNSVSKIKELAADGAVTRSLSCKPSIVPDLCKSRTNKFIRYELVGKTGVDVFGDTDPQAIKTVVDNNDDIFKTMYRQNKQLMPVSNFTPNRKKSGFRLLREIVTELDTNYELSINGVGKILTEFDVYSRLTLKQFNMLSRLESFDKIKRSIQNGLIGGVKVIPPISKADSRILINNTLLVQRKEAAPADVFKSVKDTNTGLKVTPPNTSGRGGFSPG